MGAQYSEYLHSEHWIDTRSKILKRDGYKCVACGDGGSFLDVHHRTYARLGRELQHDLRTLCHECHENIHRIVNAWPKTKKDVLRVATNKYIAKMQGNRKAGNKSFMMLKIRIKVRSRQNLPKLVLKPKKGWNMSV